MKVKGGTMYKWSFALLMGAVLSWSVVGAAFAATTGNPHPVRLAESVGAQPSGSDLGLVQEISGTVQLSPGNAMIAKAIELVFGADEDQVVEIHDQIHGWGEVFMVFMLADKTGQSADDILTMRQDGMGWGQIFRESDLKPGLGTNNLGGAVSGRTQPATTTSTSTGTTTGPDTTTTDTTSPTLHGNPDKGGDHPNSGRPSEGNDKSNEGKGKGHNK
jgi:hypothetical protein